MQKPTKAEFDQLLATLPTPDAVRSELTTSVRRVHVLRQLLKLSETAARRPLPARPAEVMTNGR